MLCRWILCFWETQLFTDSLSGGDFVRNWTKPFQLKDPKAERTVLVPSALGPSPEHLNPAAPCARYRSQPHTIVTVAQKGPWSQYETHHADSQDKALSFIVAFQEERRKEHSVLTKMPACCLYCWDLFGFVSLHLAFSYNSRFGLLQYMEQAGPTDISSPSTLWAAWRDARHI